MAETIKVKFKKNSWDAFLAIGRVNGIDLDTPTVVDGTEDELEIEILDGFERSKVAAALAEIEDLTVLE